VQRAFLLPALRLGEEQKDEQELSKRMGTNHFVEIEVKNFVLGKALKELNMILV